jgi:hypothetical protein
MSGGYHLRLSQESLQRRISSEADSGQPREPTSGVQNPNGRTCSEGLALVPVFPAERPSATVCSRLQPTPFAAKYHRLDGVVYIPFQVQSNPDEGFNEFCLFPSNLVLSSSS